MPDPAMLGAIGGTPLVPIRKLVPPGSADVFVKLEYYNPTGSYKDRMAKAIIEAAERRGDLRPGMTVVEYTGGSTGSSLAFVCAVKGYRCRLVSSDAIAGEKLRTMEAFGAALDLVPSPTGDITPELVSRMRKHAQLLALAPDTYFTDQLENHDALIGYEEMGQELLRQLPGRVAAFCGGVGVGGMLMGVARTLRRVDPTTRIVALEPATAALLSSGRSGSHHVEGVGLGVVPPLLDRALFDEARGIDEPEARQMCRRLAREEGILAGTSTGLNVVGALQLARELGSGSTVVTVACDTGLKYLAGDLFGNQPPPNKNP